LQDTPARRFHTAPRRRRHDVSWSGRRESNVPMGWWLEMQSFLRCYKRVPLPVPRCSSLGYLQATNPPFASVSAPPPPTHLRHASLTVSRSNKRPERKTASAFPNWTCADERSFKRPLAATGVLVRASWVTSSRALRASPSIVVGMPVAAVPTSGSRYNGP